MRHVSWSQESTKSTVHGHRVTARELDAIVKYWGFEMEQLPPNNEKCTIPVTDEVKFGGLTSDSVTFSTVLIDYQSVQRAFNSLEPGVNSYCALPVYAF